jgi:LPS-assembly protein
VKISVNHNSKLNKLRRSTSAATLLLGLIISTGPALAIVNKPLVQPITTAPVAGTAVDVEADKVTFDPKTKTATASGKVVMVYGPYTLVATYVEYNQLTGDFKANGSVELREPNGNIMQAQKIALTNKFAKGFANHVTALLTNNAKIKAEYAERQDGDIAVFEKVQYTACDLEELTGKPPVWEIVTDQTTHDRAAHNLYHINPRLKIKGVTVLAAPYWTQPDPSVKRRTGWLAPYAKFGTTYGAGIAAPYFWALAPNYDLTVTPFVTTKLDIAADVEWRHRLASGSYNIRAFGAYQPSPPTNIEDNQNWRGAIQSRGDFTINNDWSWGWQGTYATDQSFLSHYGYDSNIIAENNIHTTGLWDQTYVSAQLLDFRSLSTGVNQDYLPTALPFVMGEKIIPQAVLGGDLKFDWSVYSIHRDVQNTPFATLNHGTDQTRATTSVEWKNQIIMDGGFVVSPFARLRSDLYLTNNVPDVTAPGGIRAGETTTRILPTAGLDMRYPLIANFDSGQSIVSPVFQIISAANETDANKIGNEDSATVSYDTNSVFLTDRFTGLDRYEGGTRANLGFTYSFIGNNGNYARASVGESIHLAGENSFLAGSGLNGTQSDLVGSLVLQPWEHLSLSYETRVEEDLSKINRQEATANLNFDSISASMGYLNFAAEPNYGRPLAEHWLSGDSRVKLDENWYAFGGLTYDFYNSSLTRKTVGLEFDCDCMNLKLAYTGSQDSISLINTNTLMLSVEFATLGGSSISGKF